MNNLELDRIMINLSLAYKEITFQSFEQIHYQIRNEIIIGVNSIQNLQRRSPEHWDFINHYFYLLTKVYPLFKEPKQVFIDKIESPFLFRHKPHQTEKRNRTTHKYIRKESHIKKELSEHRKNKNEFRDFKQVRKDKSKRFDPWAGDLSSQFKKTTSKKNRRRTKQNIHEARSESNYDNLYFNHYHLIEDSWGWD